MGLVLRGDKYEEIFVACVYDYNDKCGNTFFDSQESVRL